MQVNGPQIWYRYTTEFGPTFNHGCIVLRLTEPVTHKRLGSDKQIPRQFSKLSLDFTAPDMAHWRSTQIVYRGMGNMLKKSGYTTSVSPWSKRRRR
jgi:hypothetical protein